MNRETGTTHDQDCTQGIKDSLGYSYRVAKAVQNMAFKTVFAFSVLFLFTYCEAKPENCSETRCNVLPVGEGFASEFRSKASEKGVRLVYLNLKIGNDSYDPLDLQDVFLPHRWVWASKISEPMLSLLDDYDILSLGLLNYQVRSMNMQLADQPSGCLANLNPRCKNLAVGGMLLRNVTVGSADELSDEKRVVCVAVINKSNDAPQHIYYNCCGIHKGPNSPSILCDRTFDGKWFTGFDGIIIILWVFMSLFLPALPLALPDCVFSLRRECEKEKCLEQQNPTVVPADEHNNNGTADQNNNTGTEDQQNNTGTTDQRNNTGAVDQHNDTGMADPHNNTGAIDQQSNEAILPDQEASDHIRNNIPVDDASPITFSTLFFKCAQKMPDIGLSFNIKLFLVYICVFPYFIYLQLGLYNTFKKMHINESVKKGISLGKVFTKHVHWSIFVTVGAKEFAWICTLTITSLAIIWFLKPGDLLFKKGFICICEKGTGIRGSHHSMGDEMHRHFEKVPDILWKAIPYFAKPVTFNISCSCQCHRASPTMYPVYHHVCRLLHSISIVFTLLVRVVLGSICFPFYLAFSLVVVFWYSPLFFILCFYIINGSRLRHSQVEGENDWKGLLTVVSTLLSLSFCYTLVIVTVVSCGFIMKALGYIIAGLVLNDYVITPYVAFVLVVITNIYLCYANMQEKYKEVKEMILKWQEELEINSNEPKGTIRTELFWFVCDSVLPLKSEICRMFRNMVLILLFLFLVVYSIVVFGNEYKASTVFSTFYVFVGGLIPALIFKGLTKGNKFIGWAKIGMEREIETAVTEYISENSTDIVFGPPVSQNGWVHN